MTPEPEAAIPAVPGLPLLGSAPALARRPHAFLTALPRHGDLTSVRLGPARACFVNHPDLVHRMLVTDADVFLRGRLFEKAKPFLGEGLVLSEGPHHRRQRRMIRQAFRHGRLVSYAATVDEVARRRIAAWPPGRPVDLVGELQRLGFDVASHVLFSADADPRVLETIQHTFPTLLAAIMRRTLAPTDLLEKLPTRSNRAFAAANREVHEALDRVIARQRATGRDTDDLFSALLAARDENTGRPMTDRQLHDEVLSILSAGGETTATALTWSAYFVSRHPPLQARLQREADDVLGDGPPDLDRLARLALTRRVITEAMRLYPPVWLLTRQATADAPLGGHTVPAGTNLFYSPYALQRDERFFDRPHVFDPDRWLPDADERRRRHAYLPFGRGVHGCVGEPLAWIEAITVLATVARRWTLEPVPGRSVRPVFRTNVVPRRLLVTPRPR
ncbi:MULTISPECIES: cytochrome P450 [Streptomyces]|uniref:Cytochrome P450 n=1 Tax=Streptomyces luteosporeus TaxID=173856 RepID=A0ABN3U6N0_9ACTN